MRPGPSGVADSRPSSMTDLDTRSYLARLRFVGLAAQRSRDFERTIRQVEETFRSASASFNALKALADREALPLYVWESEGGAL